MGGAQEYYGNNARMTTLGRSLAALPYRVIGGKREIMEKTFPRQDLFTRQENIQRQPCIDGQAGLAMINRLKKEKRSRIKLNSGRDSMRAALSDILAR